jgi:FkbM family methyltransferase
VLLNLEDMFTSPMQIAESRRSLRALLKTIGFFAKVLPARLPELTYTTLLKPKPLRRLAHRIFLRCVPSHVTIDGLKLYLNPSDPVLSPSVAFGIYENYEQDIFRSFCKPGAIVVDVGANVGLYTLIAASRVGKNGKVIAIEPHPESYRYLQKTIELNGLNSVRSFNVALGDRRRKIDLFLTDENKADSRIYDATGQRQKITAEMIDLDHLLAENEITAVHVIKMDIQGAESVALRGMLKTLAQNPQVAIFTEFWPWGIEETGESPTDFLHGLSRAGFRFQAIDESRRELIDIPEIELLIARHNKLQYTGADFRRSHANLLCIKDCKSDSESPQALQPF